MTEQLKVATRREVIQAVVSRYQASSRPEKQQILNELTKVTGFHRKHALRVLKRWRTSTQDPRLAAKPRAGLYDEAVQQALGVLWEASDRLCGKRLKQAIPGLVEAMERHGHLQLAAEVRCRLWAVSAATIDRLLKPMREPGRPSRRRAGVGSLLRNAIAVRTFGDWHDPAPGYFEMDLVAHCGKSVVGSYAHSLVLTDIASGWTECAALVMREQTLVVQTLEQLRAKLPVPLRGLDVDNDSAFINETLISYCRQRGLELTRCRAYRKNDQAWIEQKNGAVVRRLVGYGRLEGRAGAAALARLHEVARLHVNFFQPSFKLKAKRREGAKVTKQYHAPATPCERLLASDRVSLEAKEQLRRTLAALDPVKLLHDIRQAQKELVALEMRDAPESATVESEDLGRFVASLSTAWRNGEIAAYPPPRQPGASDVAHAGGPLRGGLAVGGAVAERAAGGHGQGIVWAASRPGVGNLSARATAHPPAAGQTVAPRGRPAAGLWRPRARGDHADFGPKRLRNRGVIDGAGLKP
jgi:hypothetical protein